MSSWSVRRTVVLVLVSLTGFVTSASATVDGEALHILRTERKAIQTKLDKPGLDPIEINRFKMDLQGLDREIERWEKNPSAPSLVTTGTSTDKQGALRAGSSTGGSRASPSPAQSFSARPGYSKLGIVEFPE